MTKRIENKGMLKRVFSVLVVLLLASAMLVGATSADGTALVFDDEFDKNHPSTYAIITEAGNYVLSNDVTGNIVIRVKDNEAVTLTAENNAKLTGLISIESASTVTITDMSFVLNDDTNSSAFQGRYNDHNTEVPAVSLKAGGTCSTIVMTGNTLDFSAVTSSKNANMFKSHGPALADGSLFHGNIVKNATGHVLNLVGIENSSTLTVEQNTVTMNPYKENRALLKTYDQTCSTKVNYRAEVVNLNYVVKDNSLVITDGNTQTGTALVAFDETKATGYNTVNVVLQGNSIDENAAFENGQTKPDKFGSFIIKDNANNVLLVKDQNQTGVTWYTENVTISNAENKYLSTGQMTLGVGSAKGVSIDGNVLTAVKVTGNVSVENKNGNTGTLKADVGITGGNVTYEVDWTIVEGTDVIEFQGADSAANQITYKPLKAGVALVGVKSASVEAEIIITVFDKIDSTVGSTAAVESTGAVNLTVSSSESIVNSTGKPLTDGAEVTEATIKTANNINITFVYDESDKAAWDATNNSLVGNVTTLVVQYPGAVAPVNDTERIVGYEVILGMDKKAANGSIILPNINPEFNETVATNVVSDQGASIVPLTMITGDHTDILAINKNITTVALVFSISKVAGEAQPNFKAYHVNGTTVNEVSVTVNPNSATGTLWNLTITSEYGFSSYVLAEDTSTPVTPPVDPKPSNSGSSGSSVWLQEPATPTEQPTQTPTDKPTDAVPTDIPVTQPTATPASPGFGILAALAGLGAVAVLRRK